MGEFINDIIESFRGFYDNVLHYLANLLSFVLVFSVGIVVSWLLYLFSKKLFRLMRVDQVSQRTELLLVLRRGGIGEPVSVLLARLLSWVSLLVFFIIALSALQMPEVERLIEGFFLYLPNIIVAAAIIFIGYIVSNFLARGALIASVNAGIRHAGLIGKATRLAILLFVFSMALEQLGIGKDTIVMAFTIIFGGIVLTLALAFGLGGKDLARSYLEKRARGPEEPEKPEKEDEFKHL